MVVRHRQMFNSYQISRIDGDQGWNHAGQPYIPIGGPVDNMTIRGGHLPSQWNPAPRSSGYPSPILNGQLPHCQSVAPAPSCDPYLHQSAVGNLHMPQDNYLLHPSSSNIGGQPITGVDDGFYDQAIGNSRRQLKRKSPGIPPLWDRGSTRRYYDVGSSSEARLPVDPWLEKQNAEWYPMHWEYPPSYRVNNPSIGGEGMVRNVRCRTRVCPDTNLVRTQLPSNSLHHSYSSSSSVQSNSFDFWGYGINAPREWNSNFVSPAAPGVAGSDSRYFNQNSNSLNLPNSHLNSSLNVGGYYNDVIVSSNTNHVPQNVSSHLNQSVRGIRGGYCERSNATFRASSSNFYPGHVASSNEGQQMAAESYPSRHQHAFSNLRMHNVDRNRRNFMSGGRYRSYTAEASFHNRSTPEELLALGEQIGSVNTGLSDVLISKCLTESIYGSSNVFQDEGTCVICLEGYENMDRVGMLKVCKHDFHVDCIRKWLLMKNSCPICKASAMDDNMKEK